MKSRKEKRQDEQLKHLAILAVKLEIAKTVLEIIKSLF